MARSNGKAAKPGPKHFSSDPAKWCNLLKPVDGKPCQAPKKAGTERCAKHQTYTTEPENIEGLQPGVVYIAPTPLQVKTLQDCADYIEQMINEVRVGHLEPVKSNACANLLREFVKVKTAIERLDPKKIAGRQVSREIAIRIASELTDAQVDEILASKEAIYIDAQQPIPTIEMPDDDVELEENDNI